MTIAREQPKISYCDGCSSQITWGEWKNSGKHMPAHQDPKGNLILIDGYWEQLRPTPDPVTRYTSHFATCPKASTFRKERSS